MIIYLTRTKNNHDFSSWEEVLFGVLQGASAYIILYLFNFFFVMKETIYKQFTSYANDKTLYDAGNTIENLILSSQETSRKWFSNNRMQGNSGKCNLILSTNEPVKI